MYVNIQKLVIIVFLCVSHMTHYVKIEKLSWQNIKENLKSRKLKIPESTKQLCPLKNRKLGRTINLGFYGNIGNAAKVTFFYT